MNPFSEFAAIIGIDWADRKHDLCLKIFGSDALEYSILEHKPEAIDDWAHDLRVRFHGRPVAICIGNQDTHPLTLLPKAGIMENINRTIWKRISHAQAPKSTHQPR